MNNNQERLAVYSGKKLDKAFDEWIMPRLKKEKSQFKYVIVPLSNCTKLDGERLVRELLRLLNEQIIASNTISNADRLATVGIWQPINATEMYYHAMIEDRNMKRRHMEAALQRAWNRMNVTAPKNFGAEKPLVLKCDCDALQSIRRLRAGSRLDECLDKSNFHLPNNLVGDTHDKRKAVRPTRRKLQYSTTSKGPVRRNLQRGWKNKNQSSNRVHHQHSLGAFKTVAEMTSLLK